MKHKKLTQDRVVYFINYVMLAVFLIIVFVIPFASLKAQTSYEKCCAPPLFDL